MDDLSLTADKIPVDPAVYGRPWRYRATFDGPPLYYQSRGYGSVLHKEMCRYSQGGHVYTTMSGASAPAAAVFLADTSMHLCRLCFRDVSVSVITSVTE